MRRMFVPILLAVCLLIISSCEDDTPSEERDTIEISGTLDSSFTIAADTDVLVQEAVVIPEGVELTAERGVHFMVSEGVVIHVEGRLITNGTNSKPVKFKSANNQLLWYGLISSLQDTLPAIELFHTTVSDCIQGIELHGDNARLSDIVISNCTYGIVCSGDSGSVLDGIEVQDCETGVSITDMSDAQVSDAWLHDNEIGLWNISTRAILQQSLVNNNTDTGIRCDGYGDSLQILFTEITENPIGIIYRYGPRVVLRGNTITSNERGIFLIVYQRNSLIIHENNIYENELFAISYEDAMPTYPEPLDISNNYWGTTDSVEIAAAIIDAYDNPGWDTLSFVPFATSPF